MAQAQQAESPKPQLNIWGERFKTNLRRNFPDLYQEYRLEGTLNQESLEAQEAFAEEVSMLVKGGMPPNQAIEMAAKENIYQYPPP